MLSSQATLGRHYYLTVLVSCQYAKKQISTSVRNNVDYWFFSDINQGMIKTIYECLSLPMNEKEFTKYLNDNNNDYAFVYYNSKEKEKALRQKTIKAKILKLKFC